MSQPMADVKSVFLDAAAVAAYNAAFAAAALPLLSPAGVRRHRRLLKGAASWPALAVELGKVEGRAEGAAGLASLHGRVTLWLALGRADEAALFEAAEAYADALRQAVETSLAGPFQRLSFGGALPEGEAFAEGGVSLRLVPVWFEFVWLYQVGGERDE